MGLNGVVLQKKNRFSVFAISGLLRFCGFTFCGFAVYIFFYLKNGNHTSGKTAYRYNNTRFGDNVVFRAMHEPAPLCSSNRAVCPVCDALIFSLFQPKM